MISWVLGFDGGVMGDVDDDTCQWQWLLGSCEKCSQTAIVVVKASVRSEETVAEMGRLIYRAFNW